MADRNFQNLVPRSISSDKKIQGFINAWLNTAGPLETETIPIELILPVIDSVSEDVLNAVAWGFHIEGYDLLESYDERLFVVKNFFDFHRYKGTKKGLELYFKTFLKRDLLAASPPSKSFLGGSLTDKEWEAWAENFPEIRVYPYRHSGTKQGGFYRADYFGAGYFFTSDAILRIGDQVVLYDPLDGSETKLETLETTRDVETKYTTQTVVACKHSNAGQACFPGRFFDACFLTDMGASARYYTLAMSVGHASETERRAAVSVRPSLTPIKIGSEIVAGKGTRGHKMFLGHRWKNEYDEPAHLFLKGKFPIRSTASDRIYRKTRLFDADRAAYSRRKTSMFAGACKLGALRPHHAEAAVDMTRTAGARTAFGGRGFLGASYLADQDARTWIEKMCRVGRMAVRASDRVLVSTANHTPVTASESVTCGDVVCGAYQLEVF